LFGLCAGNLATIPTRGRDSLFPTLLRTSFSPLDSGGGRVPLRSSSGIALMTPIPSWGPRREWKQSASTALSTRTPESLVVLVFVISVLGRNSLFSAVGPLSPPGESG